VVSLTDETVADPDALQLGVVDVGEQALAPAQRLHDEIDGTPRAPLCWLAHGCVQLTLFLRGQRVEPDILCGGETEQPDQTGPERLAWNGGATSNCRE